MRWSEMELEERKEGVKMDREETKSEVIELEVIEERNRVRCSQRKGEKEEAKNDRRNEKM